METKKVKWERLDHHARIPTLSEDGSYFSIYAPAYYSMQENTRHVVPTGLAVELPPNYQIIFKPVPKLLNYGITCHNSIIHKSDDYFDKTGKNQIYVILDIDQDHSYTFWSDQELVRGIIVYTPPVEFEDVTDFGESVTEDIESEVIEDVKKVIIRQFGTDEEKAALECECQECDCCESDGQSECNITKATNS